jgi:hypothetical protein
MLTVGGGGEEPPPPQAASSKAAVKPTHVWITMQGGLRVAIGMRGSQRTAVAARTKTIGIHFTVHSQVSGKGFGSGATVWRDGCLAQCTAPELVLTFF